MQQSATRCAPGAPDLAARGREFGEEVLEALLWDAVEDELRTIEPGAATADFAAGLARWGEELFERWKREVDGFLEALAEDGVESDGRVPSGSGDQAGTRWLTDPTFGIAARGRRTMPLRSISSCTTRAPTTSSRSRVMVRAIQSM